jgi:CelD/BcsL family acetyltransferase involved in cellulose biosynthesis
MLEVEVIRDPAGLEPIRDAWRALAEQRGNAFVTPEWFFAWLRHYGGSSTPCVPVVRSQEGELLGLLPFVVMPAGRSRSLQFSGGNLGDHFHPVALERSESAVAAASAEALAPQRNDWALAVFHNVAEHAPWVTEFASASGRRLATTWDTPQPLPYIALDDLTWEEFLAGRSGSLRKALSYELRRLERSHEVALRAGVTTANVEDEMEQFFRLHDLRWSQRGGSSLASDHARAFLVDFAGVAQKAGWLRLWFLEVDGEAIGAWLGWRVGERYAFFQSGFDPAWPRHSPGLLLVGHTIRSAIAEGASEYDMLLGDEAYKGRFAAAQRAVSTVALTPAIGRSRVTAVVDIGLRRVGRKLPPVIRERVRELTQPVIRRLPTNRNR